MRHEPKDNANIAIVSSDADSNENNDNNDDNDNENNDNNDDNDNENNANNDNNEKPNLEENNGYSGTHFLYEIYYCIFKDLRNLKF